VKEKPIEKKEPPKDVKKDAPPPKESSYWTIDHLGRRKKVIVRK
jgi:hypothetical protein